MNERVSAQILANILADCYGVKAISDRDVWEKYRRFMQRRWRLTDAQSRAAAECIRGYRNEEIASRLGISVETVNKQLDAVYLKVGVRGRSELAAILLQEAGGIQSTI